MKGNGNYHAGEKIMEKAFADILLTQNRFYDFLNYLLDKDTKITFVPPHQKIEKKIRIDLQNIYENNHSEEIAKILAKLTPKDKEVVSTLTKQKKTKKQSQLTKEERLENVKGAFKNKSKEIPENLILVDDIFTTGATMRECAKTLKKEGVKKVWGFTLARTI
jgi:ComF family protein